MPVPLRPTQHHSEFDAADLAQRKGGLRISVCLPARDEESTVGEIVSTIREALVLDVALVDEVLVIDDHSRDRTAAAAAGAGARVLAAAEISPELAAGPGKGAALWRSLQVAKGEVVVWCDADIVGFDPSFVTSLAGPLLLDEEVAFVKGFYERPLVAGVDGGGRVTELVARPALALLFPELSGIVQPLSGEYAGRREALSQLRFASGYGVDIGLLIDVFERFGPAALAQVDLGERQHRNRPLHELGPQAAEVLQAVLARADPGLVKGPATLVRPGMAPCPVRDDELPALVDLEREEPAS